jgi:hypothetical protein
MIDLPSPLWIPSKPAIVRAASLDDLRRVREFKKNYLRASFLPGMFPAFSFAEVTGAFPVVQATNSSGTTNFGSETTHAAALPASISSGDLLLLFVSISTAANTLTTPSGWTSLFNTTNTIRFACYYKVASGSEGASVNVTASTAEKWACNSYRVTGYQGTPEAGTSATGSSANPNPPSVSPSWGSAKTLWIAASADNALSTTTPTAPTDYGNLVNHSHTVIGINQLRTASVRRELEASSEDPGTFTLGGSGAWVAQTVAVRPA